MKRKMLAVLLAASMAVSPLGTVGTMAAEQTEAEEKTVDAETEAEETVETEEETVAEEETVEVEETAVEEQVEATAEISGTCGDYVTWSLENGMLSIMGTGVTYDYYDSRDVPWYDRCAEITAVVIDAGITDLGVALFSGLRNVISIDIPMGVTHIGTGTFFDCINLQNLTIPTSVTSIGSYAFENCTGLQILTIPESVVSIGYNTFYNCRNLKELRFYGNAPKNASSCIDEWYEGGKMFPYVYYPSGNDTWTADVIETMGRYATWIPYGDKTVEILREPQDVEARPGYAAEFKIMATGEELSYQWQYSINGIDWYNIENEQNKNLNVKACKENYGRMYHCIVTDVYGKKETSERAVLRQSPIETEGSFGDSAGWKYENGTLHISGEGTTGNYDRVWSMYDETLVNTPWFDYHDEITEIIIDDGITDIGDYLFAYLKNVENINLPKTIAAVGYNAFQGCSGLKTVDLPEEVTEIKNNMFNNCTSLQTVTIPEGVTKIGYGAFNNCMSLQKLIIPKNVTEIGHGAFLNCDNLKELKFCGNAPLYPEYCIGNPNDNTKISHVYYPSGNSTWTYDVMMSMGSNAMWIPYGDTTIEILVHPQDVESKAGRTVKFTVIVAGEGLNYQWQYSDDNGANWKNSGMEGNQTDTVSVKVNEEDFGRLYRCVVKDNKNEAISDSAVLQKKIVPTEGKCGVDAEWSYANGKLTIEGSGAMYDYQCGYWDDLQGVYVPDINTPWYDYYDEVETVVIDDRITYLGNYLFADFEKLDTVNIPQGVTHIGAYAFSHCFSLETIDLPEGLEYIGAYAFDVWTENPACNAFRNLSIPDNVTFIGNYAFRGCHFEEIEIPESFELLYSDIRNLNRENNHIFDSCKQLKKVQLPENMEVVPICMFYGCSALEECNLPDALTDIYDCAFSNSGVKFTELPQNLKRIEKFAFSECSNIQTITIPASVEKIDDRAFTKCANLETMIFTGNPPETCHLENLTIRGYYPTGNAEWTEERMQEIGSSMTWIPYGDVNEILTITEQPKDIEAKVGDTVSFTVKATGKDLRYQWQYSDDGVIWYDSESEGSQTDTLSVEVLTEYNSQMYHCVIKDGNGAEAVSDPAVLKITKGICGESASWYYANGTLYIKGSGATYDYELDESMSLPVAKTPWYDYRDKITAVSIDDGITHLGSYLFAYLKNVKTITIPESVESLGDCVFTESGLLEAVIPANVKTMAYGTFMNCSELTDVTLPAELTGIPDSAFEGCRKLTNILIPEGVTSIGSYAFMDCLSLETLELPEGLEAVYDGAFDVRSGVELEGCEAFRNLSIPSTVTHIGYGAFRGCNFEEITVPESAVTVEGAVFEYCTKLSEVHLPETMEVIPEYAFDGCANLQELTVPAGVTAIGRGAFMNCENLKNLRFCGNAPSEPSFCIGNGGHTLINTVYYPSDNATWTSNVKEIMGPDATWISYESRQNPFTDVSESRYDYDAILWAVENEITTGISATTFAPDETATRAQVVTFLWRQKGCPKPKTTVNPFKDVSKSAYYYDAVLWAAENGIATGTSATLFSPEDEIIRGQFVTFLYRMNEEPAYKTDNPFTDVKTWDYWHDAVLWAYENGITTGIDKEQTLFAPSNSCTRGQTVTLIYRAK